MSDRSQMMGELTGLHDARLNYAAGQLKATGARTVLDLGCGSGGLLYRLAGDPQFERIVGLEASGQALRQARLNLDELLEDTEGRICLLAGSYMERQPTLTGFDAAALIETIEHVKPEYLALVERSVFVQMQPGAVLVTTPNREYNPLYGLMPGQFREADHKFEWDRAKYRHWCSGVAERNGYSVTFGGVGEADMECGPPTQTALFKRRNAESAYQ